MAIDHEELVHQMEMKILLMQVIVRNLNEKLPLTLGRISYIVGRAKESRGDKGEEGGSRADMRLVSRRDE